MSDNQLKFNVRLDSKNGKDIHRTFKGTFFRNDSSMAIAEVRDTRKLIVEKGVYRDPNGREYNLDDITTGTRLQFEKENFVVTQVEGQIAEQPPIVDQKDGVWDERLQSIRDSMRQKIRERGASTIQGLGRHFKILDDSRDNGIDEREFSKAVREYGFNLNDEDQRLLMRSFDRDKNGTISYEEFLRGVLGDMNEFRKQLVSKAFKKLDANKNGVIQLDDIKLFYNAKYAPEVTSGKKTEDEVLLEFLGNFDTITKDGTVTYEVRASDRVDRQEFEEYYNGVSVSIERDDYFALMMQNTWKVQ